MHRGVSRVLRFAIDDEGLDLVGDREELLGVTVDLQVHEAEVLAVLASRDDGPAIDDVVVCEVGVRRHDRVDVVSDTVDDLAKLRLGRDARGVSCRCALVDEEDHDIGLAVVGVTVAKRGGRVVDRLGDAAHLKILDALW